MRAFQEDLSNTFGTHGRNKAIAKPVASRQIQGFRVDMTEAGSGEGDAHADGTWIFSFADLIMNLLMFFVMMFAISSVDKGKFKEVQEAISTFQNKPTTKSAPIAMNGNGSEAGFAPSSGVSSAEARMSSFEVLEGVKSLLAKLNPKELAESARLTSEMELLSKKISKLSEMVEAQIKADPQSNAFEVVFAAQRLFSDKNETSIIKPEGALLIRKLAHELVMMNRPFDIVVQGFVANSLGTSSNKFARTQAFDLTSRRAAGVVEMLAESELGSAHHRFSAAGYGGFAEVNGPSQRLSPLLDRVVVRVGLLSVQGKKK